MSTRDGTLVLQKIDDRDDTGQEVWVESGNATPQV